MGHITMAQANAALLKLPDDIASEVRTVTGVTAFNVARMAQAATPISKGQPQGRAHLRENELWTWSGKLAAIVRVAKETFHWRFLEYGTVHMRALGMFRHAKEANQADHENRLNGALQRANSRLNL